MSSALSITAFGSRVVPRQPCAISFRPPRFLVEHGGRAVAFGAANGRLGFSPIGGATVGEVTLDIEDVPLIPAFSVATEHFAFIAGANTKLYSTRAGTRWPFELVREDAAHDDEMLHVQGPFAWRPPLTSSEPSMRVVADGRVEKHNGEAQWREWEYARGGQTWRQRLVAVTLFSIERPGLASHFVVTAQCSTDRSAAFLPFVDAFVESLGAVS